MDAPSRHLAAQVTKGSGYRAYDLTLADTDTGCISADIVYQLYVGIQKAVYEMDCRLFCKLFRAHNDLWSGTWIIKTTYSCLKLEISGMRKSLIEQELMTEVIQFAAECQCNCMQINSHSADESSKLKQLMIQGTSIGTDKYDICRNLFLHCIDSDRMPKSIDEVMMGTTFGIKYINLHFEFVIDSNLKSMST
jgi:hypothetical protein